MYKISKNRALNILGLEYENFIHKLAEGEDSTMTFSQTSATINNLAVNNVRPKDVLVVKCIQNGVDYVMDLLRKDDLFFDKQTLKMINRYVASDEKTIYNMMVKKQVEILKDYLTNEELEKF